MAWILLLIAGACEMVWPLGFKYTNGFKTNYGATALTFAIMGVSLWLMAQATARGIHVGTAYAIWTGLGAAGTAVLGMIIFKEPRDTLRIAFLLMIILGAIGLKFISPPATSVPVGEPATTEAQA